MSAEKTVTYSLRLPEVWKRRLERTADHQALSVNQVVMDIIGRYYKGAGFHDSTSIHLKNGRRLDVRVKPVEQHPPGIPTCWFFLDDPSRNCEVACYQIGASTQLVRQFGISSADEYEVVSELGLALLHFHNERGANITKLEWQQLPTKSDLRILDFYDLKRTDKTYIVSQPDFHQALKQQQWHDRYLKADVRPVLSKTIALTLQQEARRHYDAHIALLIEQDQDGVAQLTKERDEVVDLINNLVPERLTKLGSHDELLNDKEVHIFSERWKAGHPDLPNNRVILEIGTATVDQTIANFVYTYLGFFVDSGQPYICRWIENGNEMERQLIAP
ncbi:MAG: hypothetical protein K2Y22_03950 [Candidatus Obscuribacterales bacterium]|nr:hypothetical protein [Candidatus Obscuribacterales bacterium]